MKIIKLIVLILASLSICTCYSQDRDTLTHYFKKNEWRVNTRVIDSTFKSIKPDNKRFTKVIILGDASPEGPCKWNYNLSQLRAEEIKNDISNTIQNEKSHLFEITYRSIYNTKRVVDSTEFHLYRRAIAIIISHTTNPIGIYRHYSQSELNIPQQIKKIAPLRTTDKTNYNKTPVLAVGTNLIYIAMGAPNLTLEYYPLKTDFTISANATIPWFKQDSKHTYFQIQRYTLAANHYPIHGQTWCGWHYGPYLEFGIYDLETRAGWIKIKQTNHRGYQGESIGCGAIAGYTLYIMRNSRVKFDFNIGIGYIHTKYREYIATDNRYPFQEYGKYNYFGPTHIGISILWDAIFRK